MPYEMPGIDLNFTRHDLNVMLETQPVKNQGRRFAAEHADAVIEEVEKLKETSAITQQWLRNKMANGECASISQVSTELV